ncbi:MAG: hypothetical protein ACJARI_003603 [Bacteroidia bacterium]|jgi:hypothetical protein
MAKIPFKHQIAVLAMATLVPVGAALAQDTSRQYDIAA